MAELFLNLLERPGAREVVQPPSDPGSNFGLGVGCEVIAVIVGETVVLTDVAASGLVNVGGFGLGNRYQLHN